MLDTATSAPGPRRARAALPVLMAAAVLTVTIAGCAGSGSSPSSSSLSSSSPSSSSNPSSSTAPSGTSSPEAGANEFFISPSRAIACQLSQEKTAAAEVYCQSGEGATAQWVKMDSSGKWTSCHAKNCEIGNAPYDSPTLAYGKSLSVGWFTCTSATNGVTCTVHGRGFRIATTGIVGVPTSPAGTSPAVPTASKSS